MSKYVAPALDKGLDILEYLSEVKISQSQMEIAQGLKKSPNELYRMLVCLEDRGYIQKSPTSGKYVLSLKLYQLAHRHTPIDGLLKAAKPILDDLASALKQSCHLSILYHGKLMVIAQAKSPGPISLSIEEGSLFSLVKTSSGHTLLALSNKNKRLKLLKNDLDYLQFSDAKKEAFSSKLEKIADQGYDISKSELAAGVTDISVPIGLPNSNLFCILAVSSLTSIAEEEKTGDSIIAQIRQAATRINEAIGG